MKTFIVPTIRLVFIMVLLSFSSYIRHKEVANEDFYGLVVLLCFYDICEIKDRLKKKDNDE